MKYTIKQVPEDFEVEEVIKIKPKQQGDYTYFWLAKKNWTTVRAIRAVAQACNTSFKRFRWAGNKDKNAVTRQVVSVFKIEPEFLEKIKIKDIEIKAIGKSDEQLFLGDLEGNKFTIVVRNLDEKDFKKIKQKQKAISKFGFPNYFWEQRFGRGNTALIGEAIINGDLEKAAKLVLCYVSKEESAEAQEARNFCQENWNKWSEILKKYPRHLDIELAVLNWLVKNPSDFGGALRKIKKTIRMLYVHAYQSWLFNKKLSELLEKNCETSEIDFFGGNLVIPKYAKKDETFFKKILEKKSELEPIEVQRMPELSMLGSERDLFVKPAKFKLDKLEPDELNKGKYKLKIKFELSKGSYATALLDVLFV